MSGVEAGIWRAGTYFKGQYLSPADVSQCKRCGIWRRTRPNAKDICGDCRTVERRAARIQPEPVDGYTAVRGPAGVVRFRPVPERMSAEDRAWCEKAADAGFWQQWERANRGCSNPMQGEAERRAMYLWTSSTSPLSPSSQADSTESTPAPVPFVSDSMFDRDNQSEGAA